MKEKKHWQSFGEKIQSETYQEDLKQEFAEPNYLEASSKRRDFLKFLGFSTAAAIAAASCETPIRKAIPYAIKPEEINPGQASNYATTFVDAGDAVSIVAKVRDGRPIKIEGNELSHVYQGGTSARVQASVLDLYDNARLRNPLKSNNSAELNTVITELKESLKSGNIALVTSTINGPANLAVIETFKSKFPNTKHIIYDADSFSAHLVANEHCYGKKVLPSLHFEKADVVIGFQCDFLGTWLNPIEFSRQYSTKRKINEKNPTLSTHIQFESIPTITGSVADIKIPIAASQSKSILAALHDMVTKNTCTLQDPIIKEAITKTADLLKKNLGKSLLVCGINDADCQKIVNQINNAINANGNTMNWGTTYNIRKGLDQDFNQFVLNLNQGIYQHVIFYDTNPVYTWCETNKLQEGLKKTSSTISLNPKLDETTSLCKYIIPTHHFLESWGDAESKTDFFSFQQPTINPLFKTNQWQDTLLALAGENTSYSDFLKNYWIKKLGSEENWFKTLQEGVLNNVNNTNFASTTLINTTITENFKNETESNSLELVFYKKVGIFTGKGAENPWLQELPDPVSRATWDNYFVVSPKFAKNNLQIDLSISEQADAYEVKPAKKVMTVKVGEQSLTLPVLIIPGTNINTIGVALGYGRNNSVGIAAQGVGQNAYPLQKFTNEAVCCHNKNVSFTVKSETYSVALTQTHHRYDTAQGVRTEVIKELTLEEFIKEPNKIVEEREHELKPYGGIENFEKQGTLYGVYDKPGVKWGMNIDMNLCNGCSACVIACTAENNVPVVGKQEVMRFHEMHWIRIDRYYSGELENPKVTFQPMLCQHCDNAPCENVCPVSATNHSSEGLNQMAYNRCIGTRYCANNCPFKVRRFNWSDYTGADSFPNNQVTKVSPTTFDMNSDLVRMVLNPDVTVRSRGVIEKCSFCVQRLQEGKLKAKEENRTLEDKDVKVACQQACPTQAITFGNANNKNSNISLTRSQNTLRQYTVLEPLHVLPNVTYLAKVRNEGDFS